MYTVIVPKGERKKKKRLETETMTYTIIAHDKVLERTTNEKYAYTLYRNLVSMYKNNKYSNFISENNYYVTLNSFEAMFFDTLLKKNFSIRLVETM